MKYALSVFFVLMFTFAVSITWAQAPRNLYDKPLNELTTNQTRCLDMGFGLDPFGHCMKERLLPWTAYGGGWISVFRWSNTKMDDSAPGNVTVNLVLNGRDGKGDLVGGLTTSNGYVRDNRSLATRPFGGVYYPLAPGNSVEAEILYPVSYDSESKPQPDPDRLAVGSLWIRYIASTDPEHLVGLVPSSLSFLSRNTQNGAYSWNATEEELPAAPNWKSQFSETFILEDRGQDFKITSFAVANPTEQPIIVEVTLHDEDGAFVAKSPKLFLQKNETRGYLFRELFADNAMFPSGKDFTGTATFAVAEPGIINPSPNPLCVVTVFQRVGDSMGNLKVYPVTRP